MKQNPKWVCLATACVFFLALTSIVVASPATEMKIEPEEVLDIQPNATFTVNVTVTDVPSTDQIPGLYGWQFNLTFNPAVLNVENVTEGSFLKQTQTGKTLFVKKLNNTRGYLLVSASIYPPYPAHGVNGSGVLGGIIFKVVSQGSSNLHFEKASCKLNTVKANTVVPMDFEVEDGSFRNVAPGLVLPLEVITGVVVIIAVGGVGGFVYFRRRRERAEEVETETETSDET